MKKLSLVAILPFVLCSCIVVPDTVEDDDTYQCEISPDKKVLRVINVAEETNSYYSLGGLLATPILMPTTAILSGTYVATHNIYRWGEKKIHCK